MLCISSPPDQLLLVSFSEKGTGKNQDTVRKGKSSHIEARHDRPLGEKES